MSASPFSRRTLSNHHDPWRPQRGRSNGSGGGILRRTLRFVIERIVAVSLWIMRQKEQLGWRKFLMRTVGIFAGLVTLYLVLLWLTLPNVRDPKIFRADQSTVITDRNGTELYRLFGDQDRTIIPDDAIPKTLKQAVVAIEDERFYQHGCIDVQGIIRAGLGGFRRGASTITQQLARNALLNRERTVTRKIREAMIACRLEGIYDKEQILSLYLNWVPFGPNVYGAEQASRTYFGKSASGLTLAESAVIASLPQRPTYLNPYGPHARTQLTEEALAKIASGKITERSQLRDDDIVIGLLGNTFGSGATVLYVGGRSDQVLKNMQDQALITEEERFKAVEELQAKEFKPLRESIRAPHFTLKIRDQVESMFQDTAEKGLLEQGGLTIQTTLDWKLQEAAEKIIAKRRDDIARLYGADNIALIALDPKTGEILAYVGNSDYADTDSGGKIDMVQVPRQPGSSFKPIVYAAAFARGYNPATVLYDVPTKFGENQPQNFDGGFWGLTTIRRALAGSRNIPAIKALYLAGGEDAVLQFAADLGAPTPLEQKRKGVVSDYGYTLAIGSGETPLVEMATAFATLADGGTLKPVKDLLRITDKNGGIIPLRSQNTTEPKEVLDPRIAYQITSILSDTGARPGEFWQSALSIPGTQAAAKTGTSNACIEWNDKEKGDCKVRKPNNLWTMGYTPDLVVGVWVGNADSKPLSDKADGLNVAAPIWREFLTEAERLEPQRKKAFDVPDGIVQPQISLLSGELPTDCTPVDQRRSDVFLNDKAPTKQDPGCVTIMVDRLTNLLPSDSCPEEALEERSFLVPLNIEDSRISPGILRDWQQGIDTWAERIRTANSGSVLPLIPTEKCDIAKTPGRLTKPMLEILVPVNGGIATYPVLTPSLQFSVGSGVLSVQYQLDGTVLQTITEPPYDPPLRVPRTVEQEGSHTLTVTLTDTYFNVLTREARFRFEEDRDPPVVRFLIPGDDVTQKKGSTLNMQAQATDAGGIKYVEIYWDQTLLTRLAKPPFTFSYPLKDATVGTHQLRAVATDYGGNTDDSRREVTVEE